MDVEVPIRRPSILFDNADGDVMRYELAQPSCFVDLNLDQVVATMTRGREEYDLKPFFHTPLHDMAGVRYRQEVMQELEVEAVNDCERCATDWRKRGASATDTSGAACCWMRSRPTATRSPCSATSLQHLM